MLTSEYRNELLEVVHEGHIAIVGEDGLYRYYNNPRTKTFMRSSAKPIQLIPTLLQGLDKKYGLTSEDIAVMCASHRAEEAHIKTLESILEKTGLKEDDLIVKPTLPLGEEAKKQALLTTGPRKLYHNCSGKHLNLMLIQRERTGSCKNYEAQDAPVVAEIEDALRLLGATSILRGTDGCGVPVFYMDMTEMAAIYYALANPERAHESLREAITKIITSVHETPHLIAGTGRICSILNTDPEIFAKGGAHGTYCFGMKNPDLGIAIKVSDGSEEPWPYVILELLRLLKPSSPAIERLKKQFPGVRLNDNGEPIGDFRTEFLLEESN